MVNQLDSALMGDLAPPLRLAILYAPPAARPSWTALLALDRRLERAALGPREPLVAQIRLAWWRETFALPAERWPPGEPLLAALRPWEDERDALAGLVDGWEGLVGGSPTAGEVSRLVAARGDAFAALARVLGAPAFAPEARRIAAGWAIDDLAARLGLGDRTAGRTSATKLPGALRPLAVLALSTENDDHRLGRMARIVRLGLFGR